jgi:hypothetical protein
MMGEVRDDVRAATTTESVNPTLRSQYQQQNSPANIEAADNSRAVDNSRVDAARVAENARGMDNSRPAGGTQALLPEHTGQLFPDNELNDLRARWDKAQIGFVDEPRAAVEQADNLVATVVKRLAEQFAAERAELEKQWDRGENVSTEDLRLAIRRYRLFFDRLLAV